MRFALYNNQKVEISSSGQLATCSCCNKTVRGRHGSQRVPHWTHISKADCDDWYEPITEWHLFWQNKFSKEYCEVPISIDGKVQRADIKLSNGNIIEVQNSPIKPEDIAQREAFYGKDLIWVLNGETLAKRTTVHCHYEASKFEIRIFLPPYVTVCPPYNIDEFFQYFMSSNCIQDYRKHDRTKALYPLRGQEIVIQFHRQEDYTKHKAYLKDKLRKSLDELYQNENTRSVVKLIDVSHTDLNLDYYKVDGLRKSYWREFIDKMSRPVFIHNMNGLPDNTVLWYQKNMIITIDSLIQLVQTAPNQVWSRSSHQ